MTAQLSLFDVDTSDKRPLPELIAAGGDGWQAFNLQYRDVDGVRFYAVQDWIAGVSLTDAPRKVWDKLKKRYPELSHLWRQLPYRATNGKTYQLDYANAESLYVIVQRMDAHSDIRDRILAYLAKSGVVLDEIRRDSSKVADLVGAGAAMDAGIKGYKNAGKSDEWIGARAESKISRNAFTQALSEALREDAPKIYGAATNTVYVGLWQRTAEQLRTELGLSKKAVLRDHFPRIALAYNSIAEVLIADELGTDHDLTWDQALLIIKNVAALIRPQIEVVSRHRGVDLITEKPLLQSRTQDQ